jgi:L-ascorbate metabolism protein UlaG (beta-lactamase superfamily)
VELTKWTHACVTLEKDTGKLVLDPGGFSETAAALAGATAVLVTHEHADHLEPDAVRAALTADPSLTLHAPQAVADRFAEFGDRVTTVAGGTAFDVAGFSVRTFGDQHALIHPRIPVIANVGYLVDDDVFHPGDSFTVPEAAVTTLLLPSSAPWAKLSEVIDYAVAVRAQRTLPIHEAVYSDFAQALVNGLAEQTLDGFGCSYEVVGAGSSLQL